MLIRVTPVLSPEREAIVTRTIGCALRVHQALGPGFHEAIYQDAMGVELEWAGLPYEREFRVAMFYRERPLRTQRLDLVVDGLVVDELPRRVLEIPVKALRPVNECFFASFVVMTSRPSWLSSPPANALRAARASSRAFARPCS